MNPVVSFRQIGGRYVQLCNHLLVIWPTHVRRIRYRVSRPAFLCRVPRAKRYLIFGWVSHYLYRLFRAHGTPVASLRRWEHHAGCSSYDVSVTLKPKSRSRFGTHEIKSAVLVKVCDAAPKKFCSISSATEVQWQNFRNCDLITA